MSYIDKFEKKYINELENNNVSIRSMVSEFLSPITNTNKNILYCALQEDTRAKSSGIYLFDKISFTVDFGGTNSVRHIFGSFEYTNSDEKDSETGAYINTDWIKLMHSKLVELDPQLAQKYLEEAKEYINSDYDKKVKIATEKYEQATKEAKETFDSSTNSAKIELDTALESISEMETTTTLSSAEITDKTDIQTEDKTTVESIETESSIDSGM